VATVILFFTNIDTADEAYAILILIFGGIFSIVLIVLVENKLKKPYLIKYKEWLRKEVLEEMFQIDDYNPTEGFDEDFVESTLLIPRGNIFVSDDYIKGSYNGCPFERSDVIVQRRQRAGKTTITTTYFRGSWTVLEYPKQISKYLSVSEGSLSLSAAPSGGFLEEIPKTHKVKFEDIGFNENFEVYAEDEHEAFYVLNPPFIEKIMELESKVEGTMKIGFINNKIHVLFHSDINQMEPSVFFAITEDCLKGVRQEMQCIVDIVETLRLHELR
jgi:Protein of unknown function (DUF3137).